jgi:excinuclease UvrABC ATPase subunit
VRVEGLSIADLLELPIAELLDHPFSGATGWKSLLDQLVALDLGYLTLGRRIDRLSGGEHQRLRVARVLGREHPDGLFLVLDEPSAGLHPHDVAQLLQVLDRVVSQGRNTIVLVEHNLDLIRASDWVIDFGPGGGPHGGRVVGQGPPETIAQRDTPTGRVLSNEDTPHISRTGKAKRRSPNLTHRPVNSETAARSGRHWLRRLLGEEVAAEDLDPVDFEGLAVMFDPEAATARPYEIGGLDVELGRLLLDEPDDVVEKPDHMARRWSERPEAELRIHPLIEELRVWGKRLPITVFDAAQRRLAHMGLEPTAALRNTEKLGNIRATGKRFQPKGNALDERRRCIQDALGIGGGYVELWEKSHGVLMTIQKRHLALNVPVVAPLAANSANLCRSHVAGRCPSCMGSGYVPVFDEGLVVATTKVDPGSEKFFRPEALGVLRGIRRSVLLPFLKRMTAEGLWPAGRAFAQLEPDERAILLHGYWQRPGPGSFLKNTQSDPEDVGSWLRWNGLFGAILYEVDRSKASEWVTRIRATSRHIVCPLCSATGLRLHAQAIPLGTASFFDWVRDATVGELVKALGKIVPKSIRSEKMKTRILHCLQPLSQAAPKARLREPIGDSRLARAVFERTVHSLTRLDVLG